MDMSYCATAGFAPVYNFDHDQRNAMHSAMQFPAAGQYMHPSLTGLQYMSNPFFQSRHIQMPDRGVLGDAKNESKPRLSKEEVDQLEKVFQENPKPSSSLKAQLADRLGLERPRINNWFQNRRAKAKQEKKQEEYEASRAAEKDASDPESPEENSPSVGPDAANDSLHPRHQPSSAAFRDDSAGALDISDAQEEAQSHDDANDDSDALDSPFAQQSNSTQDDTSDVFQSPLSYEFSPVEHSSNFAAFPQTKHNFATPAQHSVYSTVGAPTQASSTSHLDGLPTPEQHMPEHSMPETFSIKDEATPSPVSDNLPMMRFKSPPPPSDIASRRKRAGPATLQTTSLNSRPLALGSAHKVAMDGSRRPSSPMTSMRRITSGTGNIPSARVQKSTASPGPRSPMFFSGRNTEAYLQYRMRSPVGSASTQFSGAPPTPMTPAVMGQQAHQEPTISSMCPDEEAYSLAFPGSMIQELKVDTNLKTPPGTPGYLANISTHNFAASQMGTSFDQPLITPFLQSDFGDLGLRSGIPNYVDMNDGSMPTTPLYPNAMITPSDDQMPFAATANGGLQYDWDANESVTSKSSPGLSRSHVQFAQNMTPQDYTPGMEY